MNSKQKNVILADIGLLFVALFWGGGFVAGKFALESITPLMLTAYRYIGATVVMVFLCGKHLKCINKKLLLSASFIGALMFIGNTLQTIGLQYTTPGKQSFIISMYTVLVPLLSWVIIKEKPSKKVLVAAAVALVGISLLTLTKDLTIGFGDGLTFLFALAFSVQLIFVGIFMKGMDPLAFTFVQFASATVMSIITAAALEEPISLFVIPQGSLWGLVYLVVFNTVMAFMLQNICQRYAPANHTAILLSSETVFGTFFAITLAGEIFTGRMVAGCVLMFAAIIISELPSITKNRKDAALKG